MTSPSCASGKSKVERETERVEKDRVREQAFETRARFRADTEEHRRQHRTGSRTVGNCFGSLLKRAASCRRARAVIRFLRKLGENVCKKKERVYGERNVEV